MIEEYKQLLKELNISYSSEQGSIFFEHKNIQYWLNDKGKIGVNPEFFGKIPHVMTDGALCVNGKIEMDFWDGDLLKFLKTIEVYGPWLFGLAPNYCVAELISELDFYLIVLMKHTVELTESIVLGDDIVNLCILNSSDLWTKMSSLEQDRWYKIFPYELESNYVYVLFHDHVYHVYYDEYAKARMRVSGNNYNSYKDRTAFIGVGSVNSYIIKKLASKGLHEYLLIDYDTVEVENMFRFAFPYIGHKKIESAKIFLQSVIEENRLVIDKYDEKINEESDNYIKDIRRIIVSVDNYIAWIEVSKYLQKYTEDGTIISFVGIDVFGRFGKHLSFTIQENERVVDYLIKFLEFVPDMEEERRQMIGNGCGKSIAMYGEMELLKLAESVCETINGEIQYVIF